MRYSHNRFVLLEKVRSTIARYDMIAPGEALLIAVSGGVDSVTLLDLLHRLAPELGLRLFIAHLDHGLRGEEAREDARSVERLGRAKGIPVTSERVDVAAIAKERRLTLEEAGREARRAFLERTARETGAHRIAVGHTRDDRAETLLFHLVRGTGPTGLIGIRPVNPPYIRPLIEATRSEVVAFARAHELSWREDSTNEDLAFSRNFIRRGAIPFLERMNPRLGEALDRTAELLREERAALDLLLERPWEEVRAAEGSGWVRLDRKRLANLPLPLHGLLLRRGILRARGDLSGVEKVHVDALRGLVSSTRAHGEVDLPGLRGRVQGDEILLESLPVEEGAPYRFPVDLGRTAFPSLDLLLELSLAPWEGPFVSPVEGGEVADADHIRFPLHLRSREPGDRFWPLGMRETKRLSDFLSDECVPFYARDSHPLLCDEEKIVWVVGVRLSEAVRVTGSTKRVLTLRAEELR